MGLNDFTSNNSSNGNAPPSFPGGGAPFAAMSGNTGNDALDLLINYNDRFKNAGPTLFRDEVVQQTIATLIGKTKPNALLVGPAGTGKTKIAEDIAWRIANNDPLIPSQLKKCIVYELPISNLVAGSGIVGQLEEKVKAVIDFAEDKNNHAILFIDEIHQLVGDTSRIYSTIAQILKPALARGDIHVIGATTSQEANNLMDDPAFNRRFTQIIVDELTQEQTVEILKLMKPGFFTHYGNKIALDDSMLPTVVQLADTYKKAGYHRPDNAITLLDRTIGEAIIQRKVLEEKAKNDPALLQAIRSVPIIPITEKQVKSTALRLMTGNHKKDDLDIDLLKMKLASIKGQDNIISEIINIVQRKELGLFPQETPTTLLFAGTSGVGKTEIVKILASVMTGVKPITLNMTEYHSPASINRIIGAPAGYIGSDSNAELPFDCLESNPYQIILLDEFEKGDRAVQRLFMSAFDEGYIKTNRGKIVDFSKAIIIATTNASHTGKAATMGFVSQTERPTIASITKSLAPYFDTELLNRFNRIITFNHLDKEIYRTIVADIYNREATRILNEHRRIKLPITIPDTDLDDIVNKTYVPEFGARPAKKAVRDYIEAQVI